MAETTSRKSEPARRWTGVIGPWAFCLLSPAFFLPVGCAPDDFASNDPLIGGGPPVRPPSGAAVGPLQPVAGVVPPLPQTAPSGTPAGLTSAPRGPLDPARGELRIGSDTASTTWQPAGGGTAGVTLQPPQPAVGGPVPLQPTAVTGGQATAGATAPSYDQLMSQLTQRGVTRLVVIPDGKTGDVTWSCVVPSKSEPGKQKHCEVRNPRDPVSALQALLEQIDKG
jgi:hypothetical protein